MCTQAQTINLYISVGKIRVILALAGTRHCRPFLPLFAANGQGPNPVLVMRPHEPGRQEGPRIGPVLIRQMKCTECVRGRETSLRMILHLIPATSTWREPALCTEPHGLTPQGRPHLQSRGRRTQKLLQGADEGWNACGKQSRMRTGRKARRSAPSVRR